MHVRWSTLWTSPEAREMKPWTSKAPPDPHPPPPFAYLQLHRAFAHAVLAQDVLPRVLGQLLLQVSPFPDHPD